MCTISFFLSIFKARIAYESKVKEDDSTVDRPMTKQLSTQGRPDPKGGLHCLWCPNKTWILPLVAFNTLTIVENRLKMRMLWAPKIKGVKNSKEQTTKHYKYQFPDTQKVLYMLFCYY
jgi:hypothetical protein